MRILEHGQKQQKTLLFFPCTAEPVWAFEDTIALLSPSTDSWDSKDGPWGAGNGSPGGILPVCGKIFKPWP